ncbi:hypothetical protein GJAV_G00157030 [Gymnothorax javanicus]|nr:hypothetical protein GJAV_G00157030 [Gymnothorax javanicus]
MVKTRLNRACQIFNIVLGITGGIVLGVAVFSHGIYHAAEEADSMLPGVVVVYCFGILVITLSVLGTYGSWKEKKWSLILYSIGASLLGITLVFIGLSAATSTEEMLEELTAHYSEKKPLDTADETTQKLIEGMQEEWDCCGLDVGYQDWGEHIAVSCRCPEMFQNSSKCIEVHHGSANMSGESVYSEVQSRPL